MLGTPFMLKALLEYFGVPKEDVRLFEEDRSGYSTKPLPGYENMDPAKRVHHLQQREFLTYFNGHHLSNMTENFTSRLSRILNEDNTVPPLEEDRDGGWVEVPDLYDFLRRRLFRAAIESILGEYILTLCPTLYDDFWAYNSALATLVKGVPKWWARGAYQARERMHDNLRLWQQTASEHFAWDDDAATGDGVAWEPSFGSALNRAMQRRYRTCGFTDTGKAANSLGFMVAYVMAGVLI